MQIENNVIVGFDKTDKHLTIPKNVVGMDCFISDMMSTISMISYSIMIFIRGLCTVEGIKIIDSCFDKYFGNIPAPDTL